MMFVKIMLEVCILVGMVGMVGMVGSLSESGLCIFRELYPFSFLVVGECPSVLLKSVVISYVDCDDDG